MDADVERLVVDRDAAVSAARHPGDIGDHLPLEVARRGLHRRLLGDLDLAERPVVDSRAPLERRNLLAPARKRLDVARDGFRVDGVRLAPGARVRLVVARPFERGFEIADLDLEPLPRAGLAGDRSERLEGVGLLLDFECRGVAEAG